jgi:hypothetical protein
MDSQNLRRALMSVAMACLLVGCASTPPDDESPIIVTPSSPATPTVEPSMSTTATPPEAPSPPAATPADLGDPSTWTVDFDRVGPLTIGLTVPELSALTGDLYERVYGDWGTDCIMGTVQETAPLNQFVWLSEDSERVGLIEFSASDGDGEFPRTADGLGLGSSLEEIQAVYGDALELEPEKYDETITQATIRRGEFAIVLDVPEGDAGATRVRVGSSPTVFLVEHCS